MNGKKIHIIGIGGTGMNGIAQLAAHAGYRVSGSDRTQNAERFGLLNHLGIEIFPQDGSGIAANTDAVIYSSAIEPDNPDIEQSKFLGLPLLHRADILARLCEGKEIIAVAGTAGKTTVTGLLGWIFEWLELDPTVYCGAAILNWRNNQSIGNVRFGTGPWIIEADESDRSFLKFHPTHAIITNIAEDHFSLDELHRLFAQFKSQVRGIVIDGTATEAEGSAEGSVRYSNISEKILKYRTDPHAAFPTLLGKHNVENVNLALALCKEIGLDMEKCRAAIRTFKGVERRLERVGPKVIDDFAHSPVKIAAALEAVFGEFPAFSAYWRPHGYTPLFQGLDGLEKVFCDFFKAHLTCKLFILPVYFAGGTVDKKITSKQFVERLHSAGAPAEFVESFHCLEKRLFKEGLPVLGMGARDPELPFFARRIAEILT